MLCGLSPRHLWEDTKRDVAIRAMEETCALPYIIRGKSILCLYPILQSMAKESFNELEGVS